MATTSHRPTVCVIDLDAVRHNVATLRGDDGVALCAVVKADGYGHGAEPVARAALAAGATWLGVALIEEAATLRDAGIDAPILLLSEPPPSAAPAVLTYNLTPFVYSPAFIAALQHAAEQQDTTVNVHVKIDTGMGRVGVANDNITQVMSILGESDRLAIEGIGTHLARADETDDAARATTRAQLDRFATALDVCADYGATPTYLHAANTAAALTSPASRKLRCATGTTTTLVRCGIGLYGLSPSVQLDVATYGLRPALTVHSHVSYVKRIVKGTPVSYGHRWHAPCDGYLATVPIGYADGVPRALTNRADVLIGGERFPMVGTITMDQLLVFCGERPVTAGDAVTLLGTDVAGGTIRIEAWAHAAGTITYEIASQLTQRLPRRYVPERTVQAEP